MVVEPEPWLGVRWGHLHIEMHSDDVAQIPALLQITARSYQIAKAAHDDTPEETGVVRFAEPNTNLDHPKAQA